MTGEVRRNWDRPGHDVIVSEREIERAAYALDSRRWLPAAAALEMRLCEQERLRLRPGIPYIFSVDPQCARCVELAKEAE